MRIARVLVGEEQRYGEVVGDKVRLWTAAPWHQGRPTDERVAMSQASLLAPAQPSKIVGVGRNFRAHIEEMGYEVPSLPSAFLKPPSALLDPGGSVVLPPVSVSNHVEHEAELAVLIGREARRVPPERALEYVFGYTCANDVSARDLQRSQPTPTHGKGWDTFCPVGPWIETELDLRAGVQIECRVNGALRQQGHTSDMVFDVAAIISYVTSFMTLFPGDLLLTGSPGGSGPLADGDEVQISIEGIGTLHHGVRADRTDSGAAAGREA